MPYGYSITMSAKLAKGHYKCFSLDTCPLERSTRFNHLTSQIRFICAMHVLFECGGKIM